MKLKTRGVASEIPTSTMADIAFLLVIYFMLTITFAATQGLDLELPEDTDRPVEIDPVEAVLVEVQGHGHLMVDGQEMELGGLLHYLEPKLRRNPDKPVIVRPLPETPYGAAVDVLDELRQGKARLGLVSEIQIALPTGREAARFWS